MNSLIPLEGQSIHLLDVSALDELRLIQRPGQPDIVREVFQAFRDSSPQRLFRLEEAVKKKDVSRIQREAHALKSSCATLGANHLASLCRRVEETEDAETLGVAAGALDEIKDEFAKVSDEIDRLLASAPKAEN